jgi:demethoxyubiquinone hydroxylase (CLK1/Coq7/Cat5 family)
MTSIQESHCPALTVLYDGACPLCRREIGVYQNLSPNDPVLSLKFLDVSQPDSVLPAGGERSDYLARFHVQQPDGQLLSGAAAFVALWATLPGWRYLAMVARLPGVTPLLELVYRAFLLVRPQMQGIAKAFEAPRVSKDLVGDLRSDHAGETGAVWIYHGLLATSRNSGVREFARRHRSTEQGHLDKIEAVLPWPQRSRLLPGWRVAGFLTGALPALFGPRAVYATIAAVETFVDQHYQHQIDKLQNRPEHGALLELLLHCQQEECEHRDEAIALRGKPPGWLLRTWCAVVGSGSAAAVGLARRL